MSVSYIYQLECKNRQLKEKLNNLYNNSVSQKEIDDKELIGWFKDIKNNGGFLPKGKIDVDFILNELGKILK